MHVQQVSRSTGKQGEVPDAWHRVRAIQNSFKMRTPEAEYTGWQFGGPTHRTREYDTKKDPLGRYTSEGLREMLTEAKEELRLFWHERFYGQRGTKLFVEPYKWSERLAFTGFEFEYPGESPAHHKRVEEYYPNEQLVQLFVFLTEPGWNGDCLLGVRNVFDYVLPDAGMTHAQLVRIVDPHPLALMINALHGRQIHDLLEAINSRGRHPDLIEKVAFRLVQAKDRLEVLGDQLAITPWSSCIIRHLQYSGEKGKEAAALLIAHLEQVAKCTRETLDSLKGDQHD